MTVLPGHSGPFRVGAIDLEIPVRRPRSFATDIVPPDQINRPSKASRRAKRGDAESSEGQDADQWAQWSPFHHGASTATLHLSTVLFTVFYPSPLSDKEAHAHHLPVAWLGRPKHKGVKALLNYLSQYGLLGPFAAVPASPAFATLVAAKMKVYCGVPLAEPSDRQARAPPPYDRIATGLFGNDPAQFPVVVFSHGLAGNRLAYSQLCSEIASQGIVVACIEHRDGSGISSVVRPPIDPRLSSKDQRAESAEPMIERLQKKGHKPHPKAAVPYFDFASVGLRSFAPEPNEKEIGMRQAQLSMRCAEIDECLHVLQRIANGEGADVVKESTRTLTTKLGGRSRHKVGVSGSLAADPLSLKDWGGKLDIGYPTLMGHSFGGATVLEYLRGEDPPFPYGIILDPWVEPVIIDDDNPRPLSAPVYVIQSESFTLWDEHFQKMKKIVADAQKANQEHRGWVLTLLGSEHLSFSDYPLLLPRIFRAAVTPISCIQIFSRASLVQIGLLRQRYRERAGKPGFKRGDSGKQRHEASKDETLGARPPPRDDEKRDPNEGPKVLDGDGESDRQVTSPCALDHSRREAEKTVHPPAAAGEPAEDSTLGSLNENSQRHWSEFVHNEQAQTKQEVVSAVDRGEDPVRPDHKDLSGKDNGDPTVDGSRNVQATSENAEKDHVQPEAPVTSATHFPNADANLYKAQLKQTEDPIFRHGEDRKNHMSLLAEAKEQAAERLWSRRGKGEKHKEDSDPASEDANKRGHVGGVKAYRTPSGGMTSKPRSSTDEVDFTTNPNDLPDSIDSDVEIVHASLKDISEGQKHKRNGIRSLMSIMYLSYGMRPGLGTPGSVLIHDLRGAMSKTEENAPTTEAKGVVNQEREKPQRKPLVKAGSSVFHK